MVRWIRRALALSIITAIVLLAIRRLRSDPRMQSVAPPSTWPPFEPGPEPVRTETAPAVDESPEWVSPVGGACPAGYPIKANASSRIFHVPGGRFYDRSRAERCYATAEAAERDGYRRAKA